MILKTDIRVYRENGCSMPYFIFKLKNTQTIDKLNKALIFQGFRQYNATSDDLKIEKLFDFILVLAEKSFHTYSHTFHIALNSLEE
jgi:hypothetical protein